jgi:hypothetical protein
MRIGGLPGPKNMPNFAIMKDASKPAPSRWIEELEALSSLHRSCEIVYRAGNGGRAVIRDRIGGLYQEGGTEWLRTGSGLAIPLDRLLEVDGKSPSHYC